MTLSLSGAFFGRKNEKKLEKNGKNSKIRIQRLKKLIFHFILPK